MSSRSGLSREGSIIGGPFRATRLWNEIITGFQHGMPLKKHRKALKFHENTFTASEAMEWLHSYLISNPNFHSGVSKEQTLQLLNKLHRAGVIRKISTSESQNSEFKDNNEIYSFPNDIERVNKPLLGSCFSPNKCSKNQPEQSSSCSKIRSQSTSSAPLRPIQNLLPYSKIRSKSLEDDDVEDEDESFNSFQPNKMEEKRRLNKSYIHNLPTNSLILLDNEDTWKSALLSQLETSLGRSVVSSIPIDISSVTYNMTKVSPKGIVQIQDKSIDIPHWVLSAMKCLANWPTAVKPRAGQAASSLPNYSGLEPDVLNVVKDYFCSLSSPLIPINLYKVFKTAYRKAESLPHYASTPNASEDTVSVLSDSRINLPPNSCYETAFMNESPITRIVPQKSTESLHLRPSDNAVFYCPSGSEEDDLPKKLSKLPLWRRSSRARKSIAVMERFRNKDKKEVKGFSSMDNLLQEGKQFLKKYNNDEKNHIIPSKTVRRQKHKRIGAESCYNNPGYTEIVYASSRYQNLVVKTPITVVPLGPHSADSVLLNPRFEEKSLCPAGVEAAFKSFRLLALVLSPSDRRKVQLLLKFMKKVSDNKDLILSPHSSTKEVIIGVFGPVIIDFPGSDQAFNRKIVELFLEKYEEIWLPPENLRRDVEERVYKSLVSKRIQDGEDPYPITFCQRIPKAVYEKSKISSSESALLDLLRFILFNCKTSMKEKKKKVRQFKESYPDIYRLQFPDEHSEPDYMKEDPSTDVFGSRSLSSKLKTVMRI